MVGGGGGREAVSNQGKGATKARSCPELDMSQLSGSQCALPQCMILHHCLRRAMARAYA